MELKRTLATAIIALALVVGGISTAIADDGDVGTDPGTLDPTPGPVVKKEWVCHNGTIDLHISVNAVEKHIALHKGDTRGECPIQPTPYPVGG